MAKSKLSDLEKKIQGIPDKVNRKPEWTLEEDAMILKYAASKGVPALSKAMGKGKTAIYHRLAYLKERLK